MTDPGCTSLNVDHFSGLLANFCEFVIPADTWITNFFGVNGDEGLGNPSSWVRSHKLTFGGCICHVR
ncbi:hypothetical protein HOLleu_38259 [Holothuria leucospilota]|uniref:Uncharacterized protein n=1 Tax=Holothuria leucospilota TaxID=206669 RepID=A0A9Q0YMZ6_HOLLE|nr:hypothetical protein HOLleu_38259 [Holothuria leucospilota]